MKIHDKVILPTEALMVKAIFFNEPSDKIIREIVAFVERTQTPHLCPHHTHTMPPKDARVVYRGEYELTPVTSAPCPCCSPYIAKYWTKGMIAWFPDERVIRLMGHQCFARANPDAQAAYDAYEAEKKRRRGITYLLKNLNLAARGRTVIANHLPIAAAVDDFRKQLHHTVNVTLNVHLLGAMRDGVLWNGKRRYATIDGLKSCIPLRVKPL